MASKNEVSVSKKPITARPSAAERRAAQIASLSTHQAKLKQEAADRRRTRIDDPAIAAPHEPSVARRRRPR
jgi:hypothetical protein